MCTTDGGGREGWVRVESTTGDHEPEKMSFYFPSKEKKWGSLSQKHTPVIFATYHRR